jgi:hypothetical protein
LCRYVLAELEDERYKRVMQDVTIRDMKDDLAEMRKELIWRRAFNFCEWHPRKVQVQAPMCALVTAEPEKKAKVGAVYMLNSVNPEL